MTSGRPAARPCGFPRCRDVDGNPRLTTGVFCPGCRNRYQRVLSWLAEDYALIRATMPLPVAGVGVKVRGVSREYGHPAAWASDTLALIANILNAAETRLREFNGHGPAPLPTVREPDRVQHALTYLADQFNALCEFQDAVNTAEELVELHRLAYIGTGRHRMAEKLPAPCPNCDTLQLVREVGQVSCMECGLRFPDEEYPRLALILAEDVRRARDRELDAWAAARHAEKQADAIA